MYICAHVCVVLQRAEEGIGFSGIRVTDVYEIYVLGTKPGSFLRVVSTLSS